VCTDNPRAKLIAGPLEANTSPPANLFKSASLNTDRDRSSLIGSALAAVTAARRPTAATINVENNLKPITGPPRGKFKVLKVSNRTLDVSERQGSGDGSHESQGSYGSHGLLPSECFLLARHFLLPIVQFRLMDADLKTMVDAGKIDVKTADAFAHLR